MGRARDDDIENDASEIEEEPFDLDMSDFRDELTEEERREYKRRGREKKHLIRRSRERIEAVVEGIPPKTLRFGLAGVVALAVLLVIVAYVYKERKREADKRAREKRFVAYAVKLMGELRQMGESYFASGGRVPPDFEKRFKPESNQDKRRKILGVAIQSQPLGSASFETVARAFNHEFASGGELARRKRWFVPGTEIYMSKGKIAIDLASYDVRIFRQDIKGKKRVLGRVVLMMFERSK